MDIRTAWVVGAVTLAVAAVVWVQAGAAGGGGDARAADAADAARRRVFIVADEKPAMDVLAGFLRGEPGCEVTYFDTADLPADLSGWAAGFMYVHKPLPRAAEKALIAYATGGGRLIVLHHGIASGKMRNPAWMRLCGMYIAPRDDPEHPWKVEGNTTHTLVNLRPGHYITSHKVVWDRWERYRSSDAPSRPARLPAMDLEGTEIFLNQHFTDGREKTVLLGFIWRGEDRTVMQDRSGWLKRTGRGWLIYFQPGHTAGDFRHPGFRQMLWNCLTWDPSAAPDGREAVVRESAEGKRKGSS